MILETMNYLEIARELDKATDLAKNYTIRFVEKNVKLIRRMLAKNKKKLTLAETRRIKLGDDHYYLNISFLVYCNEIIPSFSIYYVIPEDWKRKDLGIVIKNSHHYWEKRGSLNYGLSIFLRHFFERYIERYIKNPETTIDEAIKMYFRNDMIGFKETNGSCYMDIITKGKHKGCYLVPCIEGLRLVKEKCYPEEGYSIRINATFVSDNELFKDQIERKIYSVDLFNAYEEDTFKDRLKLSTK